MTAYLSAAASLLSRWATAFHLWCAERELRSQNAPTADAQRARDENLDRLRAYRRRGVFPVNAHDDSRLSPCFIDASGRQCAVAFLMHESGAADAAATVAARANVARLPDMHFPELEAWASASGLTKAELARIQPGYPPTPEQSAEYAAIIRPLLIVGGLSAVSTLFNVGCLLLAFRPRLSSANLGIVAGFVSIWLGVRLECERFPYTPELSSGLENASTFSIGLGVLSVVFGVLALVAQRRKRTTPVGEPDSLDSDG